ncbi:uncharacterized protein V3H82_027383 [Fundulus diaphanus]
MQANKKGLREKQTHRHLSRTCRRATTTETITTDNMVMMKSPVTLATCLLLLSSLVLQTQAKFGPDECCFKFIPKLTKRGVVSFRYTDAMCSMKGVLFTIKNGKEYCADPDQDWAKDIIKSKEKNQTKGVRHSTTTVSQKQTVVQFLITEDMSNGAEERGFKKEDSRKKTQERRLKIEDRLAKGLRNPLSLRTSKAEPNALLRVPSTICGQ